MWKIVVLTIDKAAKMALKASDTKQLKIRKEVWNRLYDEDLLEIPTLPYKIVPFFKGMDAAVEKLLELDVVKNTDKILLSMEKTLRTLRYRILQMKDTMYATTYRSHLSTVCRVDAPENANKFAYKQCANLVIKNRNNSIMEGEVQFDILVVSSVAVTKTGKRICKDDLLGELEFCILSYLGYVTPETVIVTLVHDLQVVDDLPSEGVEQHSLPVDYIVTPTQVIKCDKGVKTSEIAWSSLLPSQLEGFAVLQNIRYRQWKEGRNVNLKGEAENPEQLQPVSLVDAKRVSRKGEKKRTLSSSDAKKRDSESKAEGGKGSGEQRRGGPSFPSRRAPGRFFRRQRRRVFNGRQSEGEFKPAIYVGELPKSMTSEQFSELLASKDVKPVNVVRHDTMAHAFAVFNSIDEVNDCLPRLEGLTFEDKPLKIELSRQTVRRRRKEDAGGDQKAPGQNGAAQPAEA